MSVTGWWQQPNGTFELLHRRSLPARSTRAGSEPARRDEIAVALG